MGYRRKVLAARVVSKRRKKLVIDNYQAAKRQCLGKAAYPSERRVKLKIEQIAEQGRRGLRYYQCPFCELFHITHKAFEGQKFVS